VGEEGIIYFLILGLVKGEEIWFVKRERQMKRKRGFPITKFKTQNENLLFSSS